MKKMLIMIPFLMLGCSGSGGGGNKIASGVFVDSSVTSLVQLDNFAQNENNFPKQLKEILIKTAYASPSNKEFKCFKGSKVGFDAVALSNVQIQFETMCDDDVDRGIRKSILKSMHGKRILLEYRGGYDARNEAIAFTFNGEDNFWGTYDDIPASGPVDNGCRDKLTFNEESGTVVIENDPDNFQVVNGGANNNQECLDAEGEDGAGTCGASQNEVCNADHYKKVLAFQFKNGRLELDPEGTDFEQNNDFVRWCLDSDSNGVCDI